MASPSGVLIVDLNPRNVELVTEFLRHAGYAAHGVSALAELDAVLAGGFEERISLALIDLTGLGSDVWERCKRLHAAGVAFITIARPLAAENGREMRSRSADAGALTALTKPLRKEQLLALVRILTGNDGDR